MKTFWITAILWLAIAGSLLPFHTAAQDAMVQTIRGTIIDEDSHVPLPGATVMVLGSDPVIGAVSDTTGHFRLTGVPIGRVNLRVSFIGYEDRLIPNLLVTSAKEVVLSVNLTESISTLHEVVVTGAPVKGEVLNEMALTSARTFSVEETQRYAGSFNDPARLVSGFAGVASNPAGDNDIIVRGNSPKGILWRLEGISIPNPNHFAGEGMTGGPINALNSAMLSNSDFLTGAFAPEYGNVTSGIFDMRLKTGNNEQREYVASASTLGLDFAAEGPFKKDGRSSYVANYRYSSLALLDNTGLVDFGGIPKYQDLSFKLQFPVNERNSFSLFGLGGLSSIDGEETDEEDEDFVLDKYHADFQLGIAGLTHTYQINQAMYLKTTVAATGTSTVYTDYLPEENDNDAFYIDDKADLKKSRYIGTSVFNYKVNARHKLETGVIYTRENYTLSSDVFNYEHGALENELGESGSADLYQAYVSWKYRISRQLMMVTGMHYLQFGLNNKYSVEPRTSLQWQVNDRNALTFGYGQHSRTEAVSIYLSKNYADDGTYTQPNKSLDLTGAYHYVLGYDHQFNEYHHLKVETYYQDLYHVPVENDPNSAWSLLNTSDGYTNRALVSKGTGRNYGVEFTIERYLHDGLYYMSTLSLYRSFYTALDGKERKSAYDNQYVGNLIGGKEFAVGNPAKNKVFFINTKVMLMGGSRYSPVDLAASQALGDEVRNDSDPLSAQGDDIFRLDFAIGLRRNKKGISTELKLDVQNILGNEAIIGEYYQAATQSIEYDRQLGMIPNIIYKISF